MGWSAGTEIMESLVLSLKKNVPRTGTRHMIYADMIPVFQDNDADDLHSAMGHDPVYDKVLLELDPIDE